ncbi:MAG TPA: hypothetical protein ENK02_10625 [Planctomycetes bacterium]|nr:hypothetical protein [Planctomycetota bacterium]
MAGENLVRDSFDPSGEVEAAAELLLDPNPRVHGPCFEKLLSSGPLAIPHLRRLVDCGDPGARARILSLMRKIEIREWGEGFRAFLRRGNFSFEDCLFQLCFLPRPLFQKKSLQNQLDQWAEILSERVQGKGSKGIAKELWKFLGGELGFRGDQHTYYHPDNCFLDQVIKNRKGIPISLCSLYLCIGERIGLDLEGVALPGHFILRVCGTRPVLMDPFHEGCILTKKACIERLSNMGYGLTRDDLNGVSSESMVLRSINNLIHSYENRKNREMVQALKAARAEMVAFIRRY